MMKRATVDTIIVATMAGVAWVVHSALNAASLNPRWKFLVYPQLGPFSGTANLLVDFILPGVPYLFAARRAWASSAICRPTVRRAIRLLILLLAIPSFWEIALTVGFVFLVVVVYRGNW